MTACDYKRGLALPPARTYPTFGPLTFFLAWHPRRNPYLHHPPPSSSGIKAHSLASLRYPPPSFRLRFAFPIDRASHNFGRSPQRTKRDQEPFLRPPIRSLLTPRAKRTKKESSIRQSALSAIVIRAFAIALLLPLAPFFRTSSSFLQVGRKPQKQIRVLGSPPICDQNSSLDGQALEVGQLFVGETLNCSSPTDRYESHEPTLPSCRPISSKFPVVVVELRKRFLRPSESNCAFTASTRASNRHDLNTPSSPPPPLTTSHFSYRRNLILT